MKHSLNVIKIIIASFVLGYLIAATTMWNYDITTYCFEQHLGVFFCGLGTFIFTLMGYVTYNEDDDK